MTPAEKEALIVKFNDIKLSLNNKNNTEDVLEIKDLINTIIEILIKN